MASPLATLGPGPLAAYWRFRREVVKAQLAAWLPAGHTLLVDLSGPHSGSASQAAAAGHTVLRVTPAVPAATPSPSEPTPGHAGPGSAPPGPGEPRHGTPGRIVPLIADPANLRFLADGSVDGVIADDSALSRHLMTEDVAAEIARILRPGGELLACVDSLVLGMAVLAEQRHWAHLADVPHAEVVLIPWPDGTITRCFGAEQLRELLTDAGLDVAWIRPRTVLSPSTVDHVLHRDPDAIPRLVQAELDAEAEESAKVRGAESFGVHLLAAARKPPGPGKKD